MKARKEQIDEELMVLKLFAINYARVLFYSQLNRFSYATKHNKLHSKKRIVIEHTICRLKRYRIPSEVFRNKLRKYDKVSDRVAGLVNYRIMNQYL